MKPKTVLNIFPVLGLLLCIFAAPSCTHKAETVINAADSSYREIHDLAYGHLPQQTYDLFLPAGRSRQTAMVIVIHGGGWISGEKEYVDSYAKRFSDDGFAAISMNYRLASDSVHYPLMLEDIDSMIACVSQHAAGWGIGNGQVGLFGYSAGGHLALLYSYSIDRARSVSAVISLAGPTDVQDPRLWAVPWMFGELKLMEGDSITSTWGLASPVRWAGIASPPTFLIHGTLDSIVPVSQSVKLDSVLRSRNASVQLLLLPGQAHTYTWDAFETLMEKSKSYLNANLKH